MNSKDLVVNYLADNEEGMKDVITWFLNEVMQREADELAGAGRYERTGSKTYLSEWDKVTIAEITIWLISLG